MWNQWVPDYILYFTDLFQQPQMEDFLRWIQKRELRHRPRWGTRWSLFHHGGWWCWHGWIEREPGRCEIHRSKLWRRDVRIEDEPSRMRAATETWMRRGMPNQPMVFLRPKTETTTLSSAKLETNSGRFCSGPNPSKGKLGFRKIPSHICRHRRRAETRLS